MPKKQVFKIGGSNEQTVLHTINNIDLHDHTITIKQKPEIFGLCCNTDEKWLAGSIDSIIDHEIEGIVYSVPI